MVVGCLPLPKLRRPKNKHNSIHPPNVSIVVPPSDPPPVSRAHLEGTADAQDASFFFGKLPLELRQLIYAEVWKQYLGEHHCNDSLRLHIHDSVPGRGALTHTACVVEAEAPYSGDPRGLQPFDEWPDPGRESPAPPEWFWSAWCLRLRWGRHWACQERVMQAWDHQTGGRAAREPCPFMPLFLACKRMHLETVSSLFSTATLVFTASSDASRFFARRPSPFLDEIRSLELSFCNPNDPLYLFRSLALASAAARDGDGGPGLGALGVEPWRELLASVRSGTPSLRHLRITVGGRTTITEERLLELLDEDGGDGPWRLPGKLVLDSTLHDVRFTREGDEVVTSVVRA